MSDLHAKPVYVSYPRKRFGMHYGSIERLKALGKHCTAFSWTFLGVGALIYALENCAAAVLAGYSGLPYLYLIAVALATWAAISKRVSYLATALDWNILVPPVVGLTFVALSFLAVYWSNQPDLIWFLPFAALMIACVVALNVAHAELGRYGIKISALSSTAAKEQFNHALQQRIAWEEDPHREQSEAFCSSEPPRL